MPERRYFAVVWSKPGYPDPAGGYALDYYPEEEAAYRRERGETIIGDFATAEEAIAAVCARLREACDEMQEVD